MSEYQVIHQKSPVFYDHYERKAELQHQTHYCPGCGHGIVHKLIAEAIDDLGLQDRTIFVSPVGCSVFAYYYFDVGNVQAAHGRAPAVATGVKRAHPDCHRHLLPGRRRPGRHRHRRDRPRRQPRREHHRLLRQQRHLRHDRRPDGPHHARRPDSTTTPWGRRPANEGYPMHICELLATLEAPAYLERVALSDNKNIMRTRRAVRKALETQKAGGFSLVEILSPCPTAWKMDPVEAQRWVRETLMKTFPLGVFRDRQPVMPAGNTPPQRALAEVLEIDTGAPRRTQPKHSTRDLTLKIAGLGGQGVLLLGQMIAEMGMREGLEVSWLPSYGPEMRSGSAHCHVCLSHERIGSPLISHPQVLVAMNELSLRKFGPTVERGGIIFYNRESLPADFRVEGVRVICLDASALADQLGSPKVANVVMLGALLEETGCLPFDTAWAVIEDSVKNKKLLELDRKALAAGREFDDRECHVGAVAGPDGFSY